MTNRETKSRFKKYIIDIKDYKVLDQLDSGGFGLVNSVQNTKTGNIYAAKTIISKGDKDKYRRMINREIGIMVKCQHPTLIKFYGYSLQDFTDQHNAVIIMELSKKGSLADLLKKVQKGLAYDNYDNTGRQIILIGIAYGMMHLHRHQIMHRDLKPGNILLDEDLHPHITDFGLSKSFEKENSKSQSQQCGTSIYMAPEVIESTHYGKKADVYSFGILMYEVVTDSTPYPLFENGKMTLFQFTNKIVNENYRPKFNVPVKKSIKKLIERCWSKNQDERPTFEEIFKMLAYNQEPNDNDVFVDDDENEDENKYYLDDVDVDDVLDYADEIQENDDQESDNSSKIKELIESLINPLRQENEDLKNQFDSIKQDNDELKNQFVSIKKDNDSMKKEISSLKTENNILKEQISLLMTKSNDVIDDEKDEPKSSNEKKETNNSNNKIECEYKGNELSGIITYLKNNKSEEETLKNEIKLSGGGGINSGLPIINLIKYDSNHINDHYYNNGHSYKSPKESWIEFDFGEKQINLTSYTIRSNCGSTNDNAHPKTWTIFVSNDRNEWTIIDKQVDNPVLNGPYKQHRFEIKNNNNKYYRYIQYHQDDSWDNNKNLQYAVYLTCIEFFGSITTPTNKL